MNFDRKHLFWILPLVFVPGLASSLLASAKHASKILIGSPMALAILAIIIYFVFWRD
jgi:hypothetical protein